jgi:hypothetical protein
MDGRTRPAPTAERPASQGPQRLQQRLARFNVFAAFRDMEGARKGLEALGRAGMEGERTSLHGPAPDDAAQRSDTAAADARMMTRFFGAAATYGAIGAAVGFVLGLILGALLVDSTGAVIVAGFLGALGVSTASALLAVSLPVQAGDTWELTFFDDYASNAVVGFHSNRRDEAERAFAVLANLEVMDIRITGPRGRAQDTARAMTR